MRIKKILWPVVLVFTFSRCHLFIYSGKLSVGLKCSRCFDMYVLLGLSYIFLVNRLISLRKAIMFAVGTLLKRSQTVVALKCLALAPW